MLLYIAMQIVCRLATDMLGAEMQKTTDCENLFLVQSHESILETENAQGSQAHQAVPAAQR